MAATTYILSDIRTRVRDLLAEATAGFWTDAALNRMINDGVRDIAIKAQCIQNINSEVTVNGTREITITGDCYKAHYLEYTTAGLGLMKMLPTQLGRIETNGSTPERWYEFHDAGIEKIGIEPLPDAVYNIDVYLADTPTEMTADGNTPSIPLEFRPLVILYAFGRALKKLKRTAQAAQIFAMYTNELMHSRLDIVEIVPDSREVTRA